MTQVKALRNRTLTCSQLELDALGNDLIAADDACDLKDIQNKLIVGDIFAVSGNLPKGFADLLILDPPYNLNKLFKNVHFKKMNNASYASWFNGLIEKLKPLLKPRATIYVCSEWNTSSLIIPILESNFVVRNRITWEREKGRGSKNNWKNSSEDIWFCTNSRDYYFNVDSVKQKRKVLAPYRDNGVPKDWQDGKDGKHRMTYPSNLWTDITVPFWSMSENTDHPTQKPEKLIAKLILASSRKGDFVFDPFVGSGTSVVVAEKLGRTWCGVDISQEYLCWARKRLIRSQTNKDIQGYEDGVFWERNTHKARQANSNQTSMFW